MRTRKRHHCKSIPREASAAFTLLEVILALAILGGAVAVLGEIMSLADERGSRAAAEAKAQIHAQTVMDQLLSGALELADAQQEEIPSTDDVRWVYSVTLLAGDVPEVQQVLVTVEQDLEDEFRPAKFQLVQWIVPPTEASSLDSQEGSTTGFDGAVSSSGASL
ncbi:MAG: type II secretion system protein [Lacipirellulaceae bacterium]